MSKPTIISTQCPHCHATIEYPYYEDINVAEHPELKSKILSREFFQYTCPFCNQSFPTVGPLLYHDPTVPALYYLSPPTFDQSTDKLDEMLEAIISIEGSNASHYQARVVSSVDKLLEKIYIQEAALDDRLVELVKLAYLKFYAKDLQSYGKIHSVLFAPKRNDADAQIVFILGEDYKSANIDFSMEYYQYFQTTFSEKLSQQSISKFEMIDENWALRFIKS